MNRSELFRAYLRILTLLQRKPEGQTMRQLVARIGYPEPMVRRVFRHMDEMSENLLLERRAETGDLVYSLKRSRKRRPLLERLRPAEVLALVDAVDLVGPTPATADLRRQLLAGLVPRGDASGTTRLMLRLVKGPPPLYRDPAVMETVRAWEAAARAAACCEVTYRSGRGRTRTGRLDPLGTVYLAGPGVWHLVGRSGRNRIRTLPAERVTAVIRIGAGSAPARDFTLADHFSLSWGVDRGRVYDVVIRFAPVPENMLAKVNRQTAGRQRQIERRPDGGFIYRDRVQGLDELRRWLRGYGLGAELLAPAALRQKMRTSLERYLERVAAVEAAVETEVDAKVETEVENAAAVPDGPTP